MAENIFAQYPIRSKGPTVMQAQEMGKRPGNKTVLYATNSGSMASGGSSTVQLSFATAVHVLSLYGAGGVVASGATAALAFRDGFTIQISRQSGDALITQATLGSAVLGTPEQPAVLPKPMFVAAGETLQIAYVNVAATTFTAYTTFTCIELR